MRYLINLNYYQPISGKEFDILSHVEVDGKSGVFFLRKPM